MMNKKMCKIGMIMIVLLLLIGCAGITSDSNIVEDTNIKETSNVSGEEYPSEKPNSIGKKNDLEETYELRDGYYKEIEITQDYGAFQPDNTTPYQELLTKTVDIHKFAEDFALTRMERGIDDVMEVLSVECLRETEKALYSVHKVEQGGLLYIFYSKEPWRTEITTNKIIQWYYVRERLSLSDFSYLEENVTTIEEAIHFNEVEQIYLNCYNADPMFQYEPGFLCVRNYLDDCLLDIKYDLVDGELVFSKYGYSEIYDLSSSTGSRSYPYEARILEMDWVE